MAARFAVKNVTDDIDTVMNTLNETLDQMPFAKRRFKAKHKRVTRAMANLAVALEDLKPYLPD